MKKHFLALLFVSLPATFLWVGCSPDNSSTSAQGGTTASMDHQGMNHGDMNHDHNATASDESDSTAADDGDVKPYPLTTCLVSGEPLGEMGQPRRVVYQGQELKFCCRDCETEFQANPEKFLAKLAKAAPSAEKAPADANASHAHQHSHP